LYQGPRGGKFGGKGGVLRKKRENPFNPKFWDLKKKKVSKGGGAENGQGVVKILTFAVGKEYKRDSSTKQENVI